MVRTCCSVSRLVEVLEVAVGSPPALVSGWAYMGATCEALPWERCSTCIVMVARAVVKVTSICFTCIRVALSSGLVSADWVGTQVMAEACSYSCVPPPS